MQDKNITFLLFKQKRDEIALLYDLYFDYFSSCVNMGGCKTPDKSTLVAAFASIFYSDVKLVYGHCGFASHPEISNMKIVYKLEPHYWLSFGNEENYIIDVLPVDGMFGISVPQAVIQDRCFKRFFPLDYLPATNWEVNQNTDFNTDIEDIISTLEILLKKVPF